MKTPYDNMVAISTKESVKQIILYCFSTENCFLALLLARYLVSKPWLTTGENFHLLWNLFMEQQIRFLAKQKKRKEIYKETNLKVTRKLYFFKN